MINIKDLSVYTKLSKKVILDNINLTINEKEIIVILGNSGAGKSTLLKTLGNLLDKSLISTQSFNNYEVAYLPQDIPSIFSYNLKVNQQIALGKVNIPLFNTIKNMLALHDVMNNLNKYPYEFSLGELQRLAMLCLISSNYKTILLDEPTSFLDAKNQQLMLESLIYLKHNLNITFVIATHNHDFGHKIANRTYLINEANLILHQIRNIEEIKSFKRNIINSPLITVENLLIYNKSKKLLSIKNLTINQGECLGITGESGCGKTILLEYIAKIQKDSLSYKGTLEYKEAIIIGYLSQDYALTFNNQRKVLASLLEIANLSMKNTPKHTKLRLILFYFKKMHLKTTLLRSSFHELSQGEKQKISLIRILLKKPTLLILDEFASNMDNNSEQEIISLINNLKNTLNLTIIIATHSQTTINNLCDRVININKLSA